MRLAPIGLVILGTLAGPAAGDSAACSCQPATACQLAEWSPEVLSGTIVRAWRQHYIDRFQLGVERVWKGASTRPGMVVTIALVDGPHFSGPRPEPGQRWVLFAAPYRAGHRRITGRQPDLTTSSCSGNWRVSRKTPLPDFPERAAVIGRLTRTVAFSGRAEAARSVRAWVDTPAGIIETTTDAEGRFRLPGVPLATPIRLRFDLERGESAPATMVGLGTHESCRAVAVNVTAGRFRD